MDNSGQFVFYGDYGHILYIIDGNQCSIELIEIAENKRGQGHGTQLMKDFFNNVSECTIFSLEAYSNSEYDSLGLDSLIRFYTNLGFVADAIQLESIKNSDSLDDNLNDRIFMEKIAD